MDIRNKSTKDLILEKQIGKVGLTAGAIGGSIGGRFISGRLLGGIGGALGGNIGAQWAASKLKTVEYTNNIVFMAPLSNAINYSYDMLSELQTLQQILNCDIVSDVPFLAAVVGGGFGNMNPTIVCLEFVPLDSVSTKIYISASAKEGLIKQKSSEKVCSLITNLLMKHSENI